MDHRDYADNAVYTIEAIYNFTAIYKPLIYNLMPRIHLNREQ
jgi:hypothetical protein